RCAGKGGRHRKPPRARRGREARGLAERQEVEPGGESRGPGFPPSSHASLRKESCMVKLHTNHGVISLELDAERAPDTVANFLQYVKDGHFDNTVFHRVIDGFMIQGGGFEPEMKQKPTRPPVKNEAGNKVPNNAYTVAMARTSDPHSASAQFFINVADNAFLNHTGQTPQG